MNKKFLAFYNANKIKIAELRLKLTKLTQLWQVILILFLLILIFSCAFYIFISLNNRNKQAVVNVVEEIKEVILPDNIPAHYIRRRIDGVYVEPVEANLYPIAVMIDNDPNARPHSGLAQANLVYEAKVESNITRFMALFVNSEELEKIGPVRSARPYFLDWATGYDALFTHVGGSPQALAQIKNENIFNLNEFYQGNYFWRDNKKIAPHNVLTSIENLNNYLNKVNAKNEGYDSWSYKNDLNKKQRPEEQIIEINFGVFDFNVEWLYNKDENNYTRYMGGFIHKDADGVEIKSKNIIIMQVASETIDSELRRKMNTIGRGKAVYCFDGICEEGVWEKNNKKIREKIFNSSQEEIEFNSGTTWIAVVQNISNIKY